jgi:hypothetical protein
MANRVKGKNVIIELLISATYYPFFCGKTMEFTPTQQLVEITSVNSTVSREYQAGMRSTTLSIGGVTVLDNTENRIAVSYLLQIMGTVKTMRIRLIDDDGDGIAITFSALITSLGLSRSFGSYSQSSVDMTVTGDVTVTVIEPPPGIVCFEPPLYIDCVAGEYIVSDPLLDNDTAVVLEVCRSGLQHNEVGGAPGNQEFRFTNSNGHVQFDSTNPFNTGEVIYILYKYQI